MLKKITGILKNTFHRNNHSLEYPQEIWDEQYALKQWDYLENISELARYSIITGYIFYLNQKGSILEIGCGTGLLYKQLKNLKIKKYKGIDLSGTAIEIARKNNDAAPVFAVADGKDFRDSGKYDVIVFNESLYYFDDCIKVLAHYKQLLIKNGVFIVSMVVDWKSDIYWKQIEKAYNILDSVQFKNKSGVTWNCKVIGLKEI